MKISDLGGEFALIDLIKKNIKLDSSVKLGIGDDTAVINLDKNNFMIFTTDNIVEDDHFRTNWSTPEQIGMKAVEINVSDIAAMGGIPRHMIVALTLKKNTEVEFVDKLYKGIKKSCNKHKINLVGGNTTHGNQLNIAIGLIGIVKKKQLCLRCNAKPGEMLCVTGSLGKGRAGLELFLNKKRGKSRSYHLKPKSRAKESKIISKYSKCMIDVSDGLASETKHICKASNIGAEIIKKNIPISKEVKKDAEKLKKNPYEFALHGGEDYELLFTLKKKYVKQLKKLIKFTIIGKILPKNKGIYLLDKKEKKGLGKGYDHFR